MLLRPEQIVQSPDYQDAYQRFSGLSTLPETDRLTRLRLLRSKGRDWPWLGGFHLPTFAEFVRSPAYLGESPLTERQVAAIETSIGPSAYEWFCLPRTYNALWLCWGKGSGKDLTIAEFKAYCAYAIASMVNPWRHFGIPLGEVMHLINVAQDRNSARQVFFERVKRMLRRPCFQHLINAKRQVGADEANFTRFIPALGYEVPILQLLSLHSGNEAAEGKNTLVWAMDEADALRTAEGNHAAQKLLKTLTTSSRFGRRQLGASFSYPREQEGFMLTNVERCANRGGPTLEWWGDKAATYEVLPWKTYIPVRRGLLGEWEEINDYRSLDGTEFYTNDSWKVFVPAAGAFMDAFGGRWIEPDSEMARTYRDDPEAFDAVYRCIPPAAEGAYFSISQKIDECIAKWLRPAAAVDPGIKVVEVTDPDGEKKVYRRIAHAIRDLKLRPDATYFLGGDAGEVNDSFALCLAHFVPPNERGYCCDRCWAIPERKLLKHYQPKALPFSGSGAPLGDWDPRDWACDHCSTVPVWVDGKAQFWGVCRPAGRMEKRKVQDRHPDGSPRYNAAGEPVYQLEKDPATGEPRPVEEAVFTPVVVEDLLIEWQPNKAKGYTVDFDSVAEVVELIARSCRLAGSKFDKWNATSTIQRLQNGGIPCEAKAFGAAEQSAMYGNYKALVYNNRVQLLPGEEKRRTQLRRLIRVNNRIDHPPGGGKDLTDAEALAFEQCCAYAAMVGKVDFGVPPQEVRAYAALDAQSLRKRADDIPVESIVGQAMRGGLVDPQRALGAAETPDDDEGMGRIL